MTPTEAFNTWFRAHWGPNPPAPDTATLLALGLAAPYTAQGITAKTKVPSKRALDLADAMVDFKQPGLPGLTFGEYYLAALLDEAGIDPDLEWLVTLNQRALVRDWQGALELVKARSSGKATSSDDELQDEIAALKAKLAQIAELAK